MIDEIQTPESSNISGASYDPDTSELTVNFTAGVAYSAVPADVWDGFKNSPSKGGYFHRQVKGRYGHRKS